MFPDWESVIEAGKKVVADSNGTVTMFTSLGDLYYALNGQMDTPRISNGVVNLEALKELLTQLCAFRDAGIVGKIDQWTPAWYASFGSEGALMATMPCYGPNNWIVPNETDGEADWALIAPPEGGFNWGGTSVSITKNSQNKALAYDYLKYITCEEGADAMSYGESIVSKVGVYDEARVKEGNPYFGGQAILDVYLNDILPTIKGITPTPYDFADICAIETVLSGMNADYTMTVEDAVEVYVDYMKNQAPELIFE